tara:strand:- start:23122 stop:23364 length:243 start_codon:yes stop_codon:yes gene_type:complete
MDLDYKRIVNSERGKIIFSIILGLGLATLFRESCKNSNCMVFKMAKIGEVKGQIFEFDDSCYKFEEKSISCKSANQQTLL